MSRNAAGEPGNGVSNYPTISADGRFVAYMSKATNLTADTVPQGLTQIYRHDRDFDEDGKFDENEPGSTQTILIVDRALRAMGIAVFPLSPAMVERFSSLPMRQICLPGLAREHVFGFEAR